MNRMRRMVLYACVLVLTGGGARAQSTLKWRFTRGDRLSYEFIQTTLTKQSTETQNFHVQSLLKLGWTWTIQSVAEKGNEATVEMVIDYVRAESSMDDKTVMVYDSEKKIVEGAGAEGVSELYGKLIGQPVHFTLASDGSTRDANFPKQVAEAVKASPFESIADGGSVLSERGLVILIAQLLPRLPEDAVGTNQPWNAELSFRSGPLQMRLQNRYTLESFQQSVAKILARIKTDIQAADGVPAQVKLKSESGSGAYEFDTKLGRLIKSELDQSFNITLVVQEREIDIGMDLSVRFAARVPN